MKLFVRALLAGAIAAGLFRGTAQAAPVPWKFDWTPSSLQVNSDSPGSWATLTNEPGRTVNTDGTFITATNITVSSDAPTGMPDEFTQFGDVTLKLKLTDLNSALPPVTFLFTGTFNTTDPLLHSTISSEASNLQFTPTGNQHVTQLIGHNEYDIRYYSYTPPGPPLSLNKGSIAYRVTVRDLNIQKAPEPTSRLLAGIGASFMGLGALRKRRQQAATAA